MNWLSSKKPLKFLAQLTRASIPLLGIVPESQDVLRASNIGQPVTVSGPDTAAGRAYADAARRLKGDPVPMTIPGEKTGFLGRLFGRRAA